MAVPKSIQKGKKAKTVPNGKKAASSAEDKGVSIPLQGQTLQNAMPSKASGTEVVAFGDINFVKSNTLLPDKISEFTYDDATPTDAIKFNIVIMQSIGENDADLMPSIVRAKREIVKTGEFNFLTSGNPLEDDPLPPVIKPAEHDKPTPSGFSMI